MFTSGTRGEFAESGGLQPGDAIATFLDSSGRPSDRYAGGGSGTRGAHRDHAAVFLGYTTDASGRRVGMRVAEQYLGSHGIHTREYRFGEGWGEGNASNYSKVEGLGGSSTASSGTASAGQFLIEEQQRRERAREEAIRETGAGPSERNPAIAARGHFHHLHEIYGHISELHAQIADLEARIERKMRKGVVTDVDATKHLARMEIGRDCDGSNQVKSPWLPYAQIAGGAPGLNVHSAPTIGEQVMLVNPDGSPDFSQALITRHGWYSQIHRLALTQPQTSLCAGQRSMCAQCRPLRIPSAARSPAR